MGGLTKKESGDKNYIAYKKRVKNMKVISTDDKGLYFSLLYDFKNGVLTDRRRLAKFRILEERYKNGTL